MQNIDVRRTDHLYRFGEDGVTIEAEIGKDVPPASILRVANDGYGATEPYIHRFNRAVKRERTFLCAGNDPVFAMTTFEVLPQNDPPLLALGEWHGAVYRGGKRYAFEEADRIAVQHLPGGTRWRIRFRALPGLCFVLYASLYGEDGIAAVLQAEGEPGTEPLTAELALLPGTIGTRTFTASYFPEDSQTFLPLLTPP